MKDNSIYQEPIGSVYPKQERNPQPASINSLNTHKEEEPLKKIEFHYQSFLIGVATVITGVLIGLLLFLLIG